MCPGCAASTARRQLRQRALGAAALVLALVVAAAASLWARAAGWQAPWVLLSFLLGLTAWLPAQWAGRRWLMPAAPEGSHPVSLDYFLDPRLGPEGWIICLHLGHPEQARHFQRHNPHAITASDWDENYHHLGTGGAPPGALP
jgi:hypothetical protein